MSQNNIHSDWLNQIDVTGPFLAIPVLSRKFATGLPPVDPQIRQKIRFAYDEWVNDCETNDPDLTLIHQSWVDLVLTALLDYESDILKSGNDINESLKLVVPEYEFTLRPDYVLINDQDNNKPFLLVQQYPPGAPLDKLIEGETWKVSPAERMVRLCRVTQTRLGLITNGEQWMLVDAPEGGITSFASWYARYWIPEPLTLQAFQVLLGVSRFFGPKEDNLITMIDESLGHQDEVTEALGKQVTRAIEVFIQKLDQIDQDRNRELLRDTEPGMLYEAGLTVMMRLVFLLCAEERGLLLLDDEKFDAFYAVSSIRQHLAQEPDFILEKRSDAWSQLLAIFRAVYGGIDHETMRMPALGGSLFDPDRFPFLEGRTNDSNWKVDLAEPLEIDNRTVLLLLESIQLYEGRTLSYQALDVEQIGYVYEGLLERTVEKTKEITIELDATQSSKQPWVTLPELESAKLEGPDSLQNLLKERLASSRVFNDLKKAVDDSAKTALLYACDNDAELCQHLLPFVHFIKKDSRGEPLVYPKGSFRVVLGSDRRDTGTHYTPKSLTEAIVKETLEPITYVGPAEGIERKDWQLKSPEQLLDLKICDMAMGSGAFLVQVVRYLSERLLEAWDNAEAGGQSITIHGLAKDDLSDQEPMSKEPAERETFAKRLIAERCIYGVDLNPLAVELAKLSIWLVTMAKDRPFGFLDHNLRSGDSLLGVHNLEQLYYLDMRPGGGSSEKLFAGNIRTKVNQAIELRRELRQRPILDIHDVEVMDRLDKQSRRLLEIPHLIADGLIGEVLAAGGRTPNVDILAVRSGEALEGIADSFSEIQEESKKSLHVCSPDVFLSKKPFHWPLEFPEVFARGDCGFEAIVGNPPFAFGKNVSLLYGKDYNSYLVKQHQGTNKNVDLVAHFFRRAMNLAETEGFVGLISTSSIAEGATKKGSLDIIAKEGDFIFAFGKRPWVGRANVLYCVIVIAKHSWNGSRMLNGTLVGYITPELTEASGIRQSPVSLSENNKKALVGVIPNGSGFFLDEDQAAVLLRENGYSDVIWPYITGKDVNAGPETARRYIINFWNYNEEQARKYKDAYAIVKEKVLPHRQQIEKSKPKLLERWWLYEANGRGLATRLGFGAFFEGATSIKNSKEKCIVIARISRTGAFTMLNRRAIFAAEVVVFADDDTGLFAILQSNVHMIFAWQFGGKMKADLRYSPSLCVEPFPFVKTSDELKKCGRDFFIARENYMHDEKVGLTKFYKIFHDELAVDSSITNLRKLSMIMDNCVLTEYGWSDLDLEHGFHGAAYLPSNDCVRFTISEKSRVELLKRLLDLNLQRQSTPYVSDEQNKYEEETSLESEVSLQKVAESSPQYSLGFDNKKGD